MNLGLFDSLVRWSELTGCSLDDSLLAMALILFIFIALLSFAFDIAADYGSVLYKCIRKLFRFVRCKFGAKKEV